MKICAPFAGIVHYTVPEGSTVTTGDVAPVIAPGPGVVDKHAHVDYADVVGGDVLLELGEG